MSEKSADVLLLGKNLYDNNEKNEQLTKQKETLAATIIHDLKNPLQAQISGLELLIKGSLGILNHSQQEIIKLTIDSAKYMLALISDILLAFKAENGRLILAPQKFDIEELIQEIINQNYFCAEEKFIKIDFKSKLTTNNREIIADKRLIRRVIENLLTNAINYSNKGTQIKIEVTKKLAEIEFNIGSESPEIPKEIAEKIFEKYTSSNSCEKIGTGLGLYFCKLAVSAHKGTIALKTSKNYNVFTFKIPH